VLAAALAAAAPAAPGAAASPAARPAHQVELARPLPAPLAEAVATVVSDEMSRLGVPGLSIAIGEGGELRFAAGFGWADVENEVPATAETTYRLASVSKPMTAVAALQLAERGRLDLDEPVSRRCPSWPQKPWPVTARQLLCHQGGVRGYRPGEPLQLRRFTSIPEALVVFRDDPLAYEPGTAVSYTTYGYCLLGCVVEGAAGRPFAEVLRDEVFAPAGMTATAVDDARVLIPRRASGYVRSQTGELLNSAMVDVTYKVPGGGLCGTAPDVARFGLALLAGRLLGRATLQQMLAPQRLRTGRVTGFGLGLTVGVRGGRREAWHIGGQERVSTLIYLRPDSGVVVGVLSNLEKVQTPLLDLSRRIADLLTADRVVR
jgi:CubicO group peptidase (beta-lactamase class C family)